MLFQRTTEWGQFYLMSCCLLIDVLMRSFQKTAVTTKGVITPNQIPLTTIVNMSAGVTVSYLHAEFQTIGPLCSQLQIVQENILSRIVLATYRKFTVATVRFTQNVSCNIYTHPRYQQVANVTV